MSLQVIIGVRIIAPDRPTVFAESSRRVLVPYQGDSGPDELAAAAAEADRLLGVTRDELAEQVADTIRQHRER